MTGTASSVESAQRFLSALFAPDDHITFRPIETWTENTGRKHSRVIYNKVSSTRVELINEPWLSKHLKMLASERANGFFGVCPRSYGDGRKYELAWQIQTVRALWTDLDNCTPDEALKRIAGAGLPEPSIVVSSGNGVHVYWILTAPVETEADTRAIFDEWVEIKGKRRPISFINDAEKKVYLSCSKTGKPVHANRPALTEVAQRVQDTCQGIASVIGGDHTQDLSRLLRLPGTLNRKNERNGNVPKLCELVSCEADLKYPFELFAEFPQKSPDLQRRKNVAKVALPAVKKLTPTKEDKLNHKILACDAASDGLRSEADFALCCFAIEKGIDKGEVWERCNDSGKFAERGEEYFELTWKNAEAHTQENMFSDSERQVKYNERAYSSDESVSDCSRSDFTDVELSLDEQSVNDTVVEVLAERTQLYDFNSRLSEIREVHVDPGKRAVATPLPAATLREIIAGNVRFFMECETKEGDIEIKFYRTPKWCVEAVAARGRWKGIPILRRVVQCPVLRTDGTVLQTDGYDEKSKLFLDSQIDFQQVPEKPSFHQVTSAVDILMDIVCDFPFLEDAHRAAWLASLLTPFARETYIGPTAPLFAFDASRAGSGKTLLVDLISSIVCGHVAHKQSVPSKDEEFRKNITAKVLNANPIEVLDNIVGHFGCASLDAALTSPLWTDRELSRSATIEAPLRMTWYATGNNIQFKSDLHRRVCHIRLEPRVERPDQVDTFKHKAIVEYVQQNRANFVAASLTILRGFFAAGKPDQKLTVWGSFEGWTSIVRNAVVWAGMPDPGLTRHAVQDGDDDTAALRELIRALDLVDPQQKGLRATEMVRTAQRSDYGIPVEHSEVLRDAIEEFTQLAIQNVGNRLAYRLKSVRRRIVGAHYLDRKTVNGQRLWVVCGPEIHTASGDSVQSAHGEARVHKECT